eukprot:6680724-Pyramimonas_sp.AAC.1
MDPGRYLHPVIRTLATFPRSSTASMACSKSPTAGPLTADARIEAAPDTPALVSAPTHDKRYTEDLNGTLSRSSNGALWLPPLITGGIDLR